jgi:hypothetical protein
MESENFMEITSMLDPFDSFFVRTNPDPWLVERQSYQIKTYNSMGFTQLYIPNVDLIPPGFK